MRAGGIRIALAAPASTSVCGPPPKALLTRWTYPEIGSSMTMPLTVLEKSLNHPVVLLLKDHRTLEGKLTGYDEHMNLVIEDCEETTEDGKRRLGTVVLRGSNVVSISRP